MIEIEHIEGIGDSVASVLPLLRELTANSSPEPYTAENLWRTELNVAVSVLILDLLVYDGIIERRYPE